MTALVPAGSGAQAVATSQRSEFEQGLALLRDTVGGTLVLSDRHAERADRSAGRVMQVGEEALAFGREVAAGAHQTADRAMEVSKQAVSLANTMREVATEVLASSEEGQKRVIQFAEKALDLSERHQNLLGAATSQTQQVLLAMIDRLQMEIEVIRQEAREGKKADCEAARARLLESLRLVLGGFEQIVQHPDQAAVIAGQFVRAVRGMVDPLERAIGEEAALALEERRRKEEEVERVARERIGEAIRASREERIHLVERTITHEIGSLKDQRESQRRYSVLLCMIPLICGYFLDRAWAAGAACIAWPAAYYIEYRLKDIDAKREWMEIYLGALNALKDDPQLTVRRAVDLQMEGRLGFRQRQPLLMEISSKQVEGYSDGRAATIPPELQTLINHARSPSQFFN